MAYYPPPTELLPIFNPADYTQNGNTTTDDIPFLTGYFVRYPVSQGSETIAGTLVSQGQITAQQNIVMTGTPATNYIQFPDGTKQYTAGGATPTLSQVLTAGNSAGTSNINLNLKNIDNGNIITTKSLRITQPNLPVIYDQSDPVLFQNAFISGDYYNYNFTVGTNTPPFSTSGNAQGNFAFGVGAMRESITNDLAVINCVALGSNSLYNLSNGSAGNVAIGTDSLASLTTNSSYCTAIGYSTGLYGVGTPLNPLRNNTFIGGYAGNNGLTTNSMYGSYNTVIGSDTVLGTNSNYTTLIGYGSASSSNTTNNEIVLGTASETVVCRNRIAFPSANSSVITTGPFFNAISFSSNNTAYATNTAIFDTTLLLTSSAPGYSFTIPTPVGYTNRTLTIANEGEYQINLLNNNSSNFLGDYGSGSSTLPIPANVNCFLFSDGTNWQVWNRTGNPVFSLAVNAPTFSYLNNYTICDSSLRFTTASNQSAVISLPPASDTQCHNTQIRIINVSTYPQTLSVATGTFAQKYGTGTSTFIVPPVSQILLFAPGGTNWQVLDTGSQPLNIPLSISTNTDLSTGGLYANCNLFITSTGSNTITLPSPNSIYGSNGILRLENSASSTSYITISIGSGTFAGVYGSGSSTMIVPVNSWVRMNSDGTNWNCNEISTHGWEYFNYIASNTTNVPAGQYYREYILGATSGGYTVNFNNWTTPTQSQLGLTSTFRRIAGSYATTYAVIMTPSSTSTSTKEIYAITSPTPATGACLLSNGNNANFTLRVCRVGFAGTGGTLGANTTIGSSLVNLSGLGSTGSIAYNSVITIAGNDYTMTGYNTWSAFSISGTAGANTNTNTFTVTGILTVGSVFTVAGANYTVTGIASTANIISSSTNMSVGAGALTFTPVIPAGGWTTAPATNPCTGLGGVSNGVYSVSPAFSSVISSGTVFTIPNNVYAWCNI